MSITLSSVISGLVYPLARDASANESKQSSSAHTSHAARMAFSYSTTFSCKAWAISISRSNRITCTISISGHRKSKLYLPAMAVWMSPRHLSRSKMARKPHSHVVTIGITSHLRVLEVSMFSERGAILSVRRAYMLFVLTRKRTDRNKPTMRPNHVYI